MKRKDVPILIILSTFLFFELFTANLFAQDIGQDKQITPNKSVIQEQPRVIEEEIVLMDPTVAQSKKWLIGGSGELWEVFGNYYAYIFSYSADTSSIERFGEIYGGTIYVGYDNFTISYTYRNGNLNSDWTLWNGVGYKWAEDQTEQEITARWLFRVSKHFNPYILAGYNYTTKNDTLTPASVAYAAGTQDFTFKSPLIGIGAIIPFNKYVGLRVDGRLMYSWGELNGYVNVAMGKYSGNFSATGSGWGGALVGTLYWNIWKGINLQLGGKFEQLNASDAGCFRKVGLFFMMGYTYKF